MRLFVRLSFYLILIFATKDILAQHVPLDFNLVKKVNGITLGKINCITQDRSGYIWLVDQSKFRLVRFDGLKMKTFMHDPADSNSLDIKEGMECIAADSVGNIWVNASTGVDKYDPATGKFIHYRYPRNEINDVGISGLLVDHLGTIWIATHRGLDRLDQKTGKFIHYKHKNDDPTSISCDIVRCLFEDHQGVLWVGTGWEFDSKSKEGGLNRYNRETGTFTRYMHDSNDSHSLAGNKVRAIFEDSRGIFWVGTDGDGLHIMDKKTGTFERLSYDPLHPEKLSRPPLVTGKDWSDHITFIIEDGAGAIWIGTFYAGITRYDPYTKEINHYDSTGKSRPKGFTDNSSWCAFRSSDGVLWISTEFEENLFRIDPLQSGISRVNMGDKVEMIYEDSLGTKWMSLRNNGLLSMDSKMPSKKYFKHDPADPYSITSSEVHFMIPDTDGFFWVGTWNGLNRFDPKSGRFRRYFYNEISKGNFADTAVFYVIKGDRGEMYVSTVKAFIVLNPKTGLIRRYVNDLKDTSSISANFITSLLKDKSGNIWIGTWTNGGLNLFDTKTKKFKHFLAGLGIQSIYKDTRGTIWVGTNNGLFYRNDSSDSFKAVDVFGKEFRISAIQVNLEDKDKNIWGNSSMGIFRLNLQKHELCFYGEKFGVNDNAYFRSSSQTRDGRFYFSKENGYYTFSPENMINHVAPKIIFTEIKINGNPVNPGNGAF